MRTVKEVSRLSGVSVRTLHHDDAIGHLKPTAVTEAGYRLYDDTALERLQAILLFRELQFPLKEIRMILDAPDFDRGLALQQQIRMLELQREHLDGLIAFARRLSETGGIPMDFTAFDRSKQEQYAAEAKARWGQTAAYQEFEERTKDQTPEDRDAAGRGLMAIFAELGTVRQLPPEGPEAQALAAKLQDYITRHFYTCTPQILRGLGQMYAAGGEMTDNIDAAGGPGTADFAARAIDVFCRK